MKLLTKFGLHVLLWALMFFYFVFAPDLFTLLFAKNGKPLQVVTTLPVESDRIHLVVEDLVPHVKDGENVYELYGWALIIPEEGLLPASFTREVILISNERNYHFSARSGYRSPDLPSELAGANIDFNTLGFSALIAEDAIKPGEYRVGIVFRDPATGSAFYWDKPASYLIKTPNTLTWKRK